MNKTIGNFNFIETELKDCYIVETNKHGDERGYFIETYKECDFKEAGLDYIFVQDNQSRSKKGVLRGLHFQKEFPQAKLVRCIEGEVFDVAVDLRKDSPTFGKWTGVVLSAEKGNQLMVPRGFAHGFVVLSEYATFCYKCDNFYNPSDEAGIMWNDPDIHVAWPIEEEPILSDKDKKRASFKDLFLVG